MVSATRKFSSNVSDPVADLLTRIRNANLAYKDDLITPVSKLNEALLTPPVVLTRTVPRVFKPSEKVTVPLGGEGFGLPGATTPMVATKVAVWP